MPTVVGEQKPVNGPEIISQDEISELINALKMQHEFINETETTFQLYAQVKSRAEAFFQYEFCKNEMSEEKTDTSWFKSLWDRFIGSGSEESEVITENNFITRLAEKPVRITSDLFD